MDREKNENMIFREIVEGASDGVYVCIADTYELLYMNSRFAELTGIDEDKFKKYEHRKCYEFILGKNKPCEFCKINKICNDKFCVREFYDEENKRYYTLKGKKINWNGINAHIEYISDDTERIKAHNQMLANEEMMMSAIKHAGIHYWNYDNKNDISQQGMTSQQEFNMPAIIENYSDNWVKMAPIDKESIPSYIKLINEVKNGAKESETEIKMYRNGIPIWMDIRFTNVFDENGYPTKAFGSAIDITARKNAENKYEMTRKSVVDNSILFLGIVNMTKNTMVEYTAAGINNQYTAEGMTWDDGFNKIISNMPFEEDRERIRIYQKRESIIAEYYNGKKDISIEYRRSVADNVVKWVKTNIYIVEDMKSHDIFAYVYTLDIDYAKQMEKIINEAVDTDYDFIAYIDGMTGKYNVYINNLIERRFKKDIEKDYDRTVVRRTEKYVVDEDRERVLQEKKLDNIINKLDTNGEYYIYFTICDDNGKFAKKRMRYTYIDKVYKKIMLTETDITSIYEMEHRKNELLKIALKNAEVASNAKMAFLSSMSHDIRTPMNAIMGSVELVKENIDDKDNIMEYLNIIETSSNHLLSLINDILMMAKIKNNKMILINECINIKSQMDNIEKITRNMFISKNQKFIMNYDKLIHENVIADGLRINRVIINLLNNACKFTPSGGKIELIVDEIPGINQKTAGLIVKIKDNGIGMSDEVKREVFDPFYTNSYDVKDNYEGTGLGLSIAKSIIEAAGGTISIESEPGHGTEVTLELQVLLGGSVLIHNADNNIMQNNEDIQYFDTKGIKILLIEDNMVNLKVAKNMLEKHGMIVDTAKDGYEGYQKFKVSGRNKYDIIFMDIQMPNMNGYEAAKAIRESGLEAAERIPIFAMSANVFPEDVKASKKAGMNEYFTKPLNYKEIQKSIYKYMKG